MKKETIHEQRDASKEGYFRDLSKITKGGGIIFIGTAVGRGLFFFYTIFLARILGPNDLGVYFLSVTIITILASLANLGLNTGVTRYVAIYSARSDRQRVKGTVVASTVISVLSSVVLVIIIFLIADHVAILAFKNPRVGVILKLLSFTLPFESAMRTLLGATQGLKLMHYTAITENVVWIGLRFLFSVIFVAIFGAALESVAWAYVLSSVLSAVLALRYVAKHLPLFEKEIRAVVEARDLIKFSIPMVLSIFLGNISRQIDLLMLGMFMPTSSVGAYGIAVRLILFAEIIFQIFNPIFNPYVSELHDKKDFSRLSRLLKTITRWNVTLSFPIFLILLFFPQYFLHFFGRAFTEAVACLSILVVAHILSSISILPSTMIFMSGRSDITAKNNTLLLLLNIVLNYFLIPKFGLIGAALSAGICFVCIGITRIAEVYHLMKIHPFSLDLWKPVTAGIISFAVVFPIHRLIQLEKHNLIEVSIAAIVLLYALLIYGFRLKEEDLYIKAMVKVKVGTMTKLSILSR